MNLNKIDPLSDMKFAQSLLDRYLLRKNIKGSDDGAQCTKIVTMSEECKQ